MLKATGIAGDDRDAVWAEGARKHYGSRENGPPVNELRDIPASEIPPLPNTSSPKPMPNFPITDIAGQNSGGPNNGA
ncbi:hypothetical protein [Mycobacterium tuberculosis]|uniref:hypothetical protein n=1 Tax=Mycobacterium tuberculosis TaxID=1773 RepID=UPI0035A0CFF6